jgi:hypothetical protein
VKEFFFNTRAVPKFESLKRVAHICAKKVHPRYMCFGLMACTGGCQHFLFLCSHDHRAVGYAGRRHLQMRDSAHIGVSVRAFAVSKHNKARTRVWNHWKERPHAGHPWSLLPSAELPAPYYHLVYNGSAPPVPPLATSPEHVLQLKVEGKSQAQEACATLVRRMHLKEGGGPVEKQVCQHRQVCIA